MSQFFFRVANYLANELIVKGLANNKSFQRFALRTSENMKKIQTDGLKNGDKVVEEMTATVSKKAGMAGRFLDALRAEVKKDIDKFSRK